MWVTESWICVWTVEYWSTITNPNTSLEPILNRTFPTGREERFYRIAVSALIGFKTDREKLCCNWLGRNQRHSDQNYKLISRIESSYIGGHRSQGRRGIYKL